MKIQVHSWTIRQIKFLLEIGISIMAGMLGMWEWQAHSMLIWRLIRESQYQESWVFALPLACLLKGSCLLFVHFYIQYKRQVEFTINMWIFMSTFNENAIFLHFEMSIHLFSSIYHKCKVYFLRMNSSPLIHKFIFMVAPYPLECGSFAKVSK